MIATLSREATRERSPHTVGTDRCVVVGAGSIGRRHLHNLRALGIETIALRTFQGQSGAPGDVRAVSSWDEVSAFRPTIAIIANPTALHVDAALEATRLGCHVLVEKPLADRVEATWQLQAAVAKRGTVALVGYHFRHHPTLRLVRDWVHAGMIGEPLTAQAHWGEYLPGWHPGEDHRLGYSARRDLGGGAVLTLSHPIDYLRWILGEVVTVGAMYAARSGHTQDVEDTAALVLETASGALATVTLDFIERPARHTLHIAGREGSLCWDARSGLASMTPCNGRPEQLVAPEAGFERNDIFVEELRHFLACASGTTTPVCTLHDGQRAVIIAEGALRSARERRFVHV